MLFDLVDGGSMKLLIPESSREVGLLLGMLVVRWWWWVVAVHSWILGPEGSSHCHVAGNRIWEWNLCGLSCYCEQRMRHVCP
jgi:hypothetical protein